MYRIIGGKSWIIVDFPKLMYFRVKFEVEILKEECLSGEMVLFSGKVDLKTKG